MATSGDPEIWLLQRIDELQDKPNWPATHKNIWQGSYDVWFSEQDRIDAYEIPKRRMASAVKQDLIQSSIKEVGKYKFEVWSLTEKGKQLIGK
jgi:hypothetical protein